MNKIATFDINYLQYLDEKSQVVQDLPEFASNNKMLIELYHKMVMVRVFDAKAVALQRTGKMGTFPASRGQEAVGVGIGHALHDEDVFVPYYRDQAIMFQRGVSMAEIYMYWGGFERGSDYACGNKDFPICIPIATQCLHAAGAAFAMKHRKQKNAVLMTIGDGGTSKGDFYEAMNVAGAWQLPLVFVVNNNQWAISVPRKIQTAAQTIAQKAIATGFDGLQVDGNDVIAVRHAVDQALENARAGKGPTLIEAVTFRSCDHTTADDMTRYIDKKEIDDAWKKEPVARLRNYLHAQGAWDENAEKKLLGEAKRQVEAAVETYLKTESEPPTAMFDHLYAELPDALVSQRNSVKGKQHA